MNDELITRQGWSHDEARKHTVVERLIERCSTYSPTGKPCSDSLVKGDWCERCLAADALEAAQAERDECERQYQAKVQEVLDVMVERDAEAALADQAARFFEFVLVPVDMRDTVDGWLAAHRERRTKEAK